MGLVVLLNKLLAARLICNDFVYCLKARPDLICGCLIFAVKNPVKVILQTIEIKQTNKELFCENSPSNFMEKAS